MNNNGRPLPVRKQVQFLVALTLLAWATQTLLAQWSRGAEVEPADDRAAPDGEAASAFVPGGDLSGAVLELRGEATVFGRDVKLKQVCRWASRDAATFAPVADLVIARLDVRRPFRVLEVDDLRLALADAGVNVALVRFSGPVECTVSRSDVAVPEGQALEQWIQAHGGGGDVAEADTTGADAARDASATRADDAAEPQPAALRQPPHVEAVPGTAAAPRDARDADDGNPGYSERESRTLRGLLLADLAVRLAIPADQLQLTFDPRDESALNLAEPTFKFNLEARRVRDLGEVAWDVTVVAGAGSRKVPVRATARAWQQQLLVTKPLARGQVIQAADLTARRALVDRMPDGELLAAAQVIGQVAARDLKAGTLVTAPLVEAVPLAKVGQFVTVTLNRGSVRVKSVGKALEGGTFGQTIRVKNEATRDVYQVILTGPQEATMASADAPAIEAAGEGVASLGQN